MGVISSIVGIEKLAALLSGDSWGLVFYLYTNNSASVVRTPRAMLLPLGLNLPGSGFVPCLGI